MHAVVVGLPQAVETVQIVLVVGHHSAPFVLGNAVDARIGFDGETQCAGQSLEFGFGDVVRVAAGNHVQVQANAGMHGDGFHDVANERTGKMPANHAVFEAFWLSGAHAVRRPEMSTTALASASVERHGGVGETADATLVSEGLLQSLAEYDGDVFDGVVRVDVGVPGGFEFSGRSANACRAPSSCDCRTARMCRCRFCRFRRG